MTDRFLITGAQGFVGSYLIQHLLDRFSSAEILGVGRSLQSSTFLHTLTCGNRVVPAPLPKGLCHLASERYSYVAIDLASRSVAELIRGFHPTAIIHLAASLRGIPEEMVYENNLKSTRGLMESIRASRGKIRLALVASTGGVYGRQELLPIPEGAPEHPIDVYSRSKLASEELVHAFAGETGTAIAIARIFNVLGPGQDELHFAGRIAGQIAAILAGESAPAVRVGPLSATRDFLDVRDACSALGTILERTCQGCFNVGSGIETRMSDLLELFLRSAGLEDKVEIQQETNRADAVPRHYANVTRLKEIGFSAQCSIGQTCRDMVDYRVLHTTDRYSNTGKISLTKAP